MRRFKELRIDMAVMGDAPSILLAYGTPDMVENYVRKLIDLFMDRSTRTYSGPRM
ncbi:MAG: hypothetical protein QW775_04420 [Ignisphaera sp.]